MPQDLFTINGYVKSLNDLLKGAKVNKIVQPLLDEVVFTLYNGKVFNLSLSANAVNCRVSLTSTLKENPANAPNFCMLLRKYLLGANIVSITTANEDRIVSIAFENLNEFKDQKNYYLNAEIMGKYSNVFLISEDKILGALKLTPQQLDSKRLCMIGAKYVYPTKKAGYNPFLIEDIKSCYANYKGENLEKFLLNNFTGFSRVTATELSHLILKNNQKFSVESAVKETYNFVNKQHEPVIIFDGLYKDFFLFNYEHLQGERQYFSDVLDAMREYYKDQEIKQFKTVKSNALLQKIASEEKKLNKKLDALNEKLECANNYEIFKVYGELLTANLYAVKKGQKSVEVINYYSPNCETILIALDETLTPNQNAQKYFKKYAKLKSTIQNVTPQIDEVLDRLNYLETIKFSISIAETNKDFLDIETELYGDETTAKNGVKLKKIKLPQSNYIEYKVGEFEVLVGKNNVQNDRLYSETKQGDIWLHVKNIPSSHVYIKTLNKEVPVWVLLTACEICAFHSKCDKNSKVEVDYTLKKYVKKQHNNRLGSVTYTNQKTLVVTPNKHENLIEKTVQN